MEPHTAEFEPFNTTDYCDQRGILVIEEAPNAHRDTADYEHGALLERTERALVDMIDRDRHHPAIFAWSISNECNNREEGVKEVQEELVSIAHEADQSRPVTYAAHTPLKDVSLDVPDFLSINNYPGWYGEGWPPTDLVIWDSNDWHEYLDRVRERAPELPLVLTEFGAGGIEGERTFDDQKWSEGYQATVLTESIETFENRDDIVGFTLWQYCDIRTTEDRFHYRPRSKNNKGIVGEHRTPKESYHAVRNILTPEE